MKITFTPFFKTALFFLLLNATNLSAQQPAPTHILYEKGKTPKAGTVVAMMDNALVFADSNGVQKVFHRLEIDSVVQITVKTIETEIAESQPDTIPYANIKIDEKFEVGSLLQEHRLTTTWGQKYSGIVTFMSVEKLVLTTQNGMDLPFKIKEIQQIEVIETPKSSEKRYKTITAPGYEAKMFNRKRTEYFSEEQERKTTHIPYRIGIVPTAFNLPKGQLLIRGSAGYLWEFVLAGKYFLASTGLSGVNSQLRLKVGIPIKAYLHAGLVAEITTNQLLYTGDAKMAFAPIFTFGTPNYFLNLAYKSESPMFVPVNDRFDEDIIREASYWSFGAGVRITDDFQFLTESLFITDDNQQPHYRVFLGVTLKTEKHTIGAGIAVWDTQNSDDNTFFDSLNVGGAVPSFQYTIRFK